MIIHKVEQGTDEWFDLRDGKMTASHAQAIGNCGKWLDTYILEMMAEKYSSWERDHYENKHTKRWNEREPLARWVYEMETGNIVDEVWFIELSDFVWCSPDWLVWDNGGLEIKCQDKKKHFDILLHWEKKIDSGYIRQIQMCLLITGRKWRDFMSYNPNYSRSFIHRITPDEEKHEKLLEWFAKWQNIILEITEKAKWL